MALTLKEAALACANLGIPVKPMYGIAQRKCTCGDPNCLRPGKHPRISGGVEVATADKKQIEEWWDKWGDANIGIVAGAPSKLLILDIDPRNGGKKALARLEEELGDLPTTVRVNTGGGGFHLYFKMPPFDVRSDTSGKVFERGIDILSTGSIALAAYSNHASGKQYRYVEGRNLLKGARVGKLPKLWCDRLKAGQKASPQTKSVEPSGVAPIMEGNRNSMMARIGGALVATGLPPQEVLKSLIHINQTRCVPTLEEAEVQKIAESVERYRTKSNASDEAPEYLAYAMTLAEHFGGGPHIRFIPKHGFHRYDGRKWVREDQTVIESLVLRTIEALPISKRPAKNTTLLADTMSLLRIKQVASADALYGDHARPIINCLNYEVHLAEDGTPVPKRHSPDSNLLQCLDIEYDPQAKCPTYDQAMREIVSKATDRKRMIRLLNEIAGYTIQPKRDIALIIMFQGGGSNGKGEFKETLIAILGKDAVFSGSLSDLERDRFLIGSLRGKYIFIDDDIRANARLPDGILKKISEAKVLSGQLKGRDYFQFTNRVFPLLLANNPPTTADLSYGMQRRLMVIPFKRRFVVGKDLDRELWPSIRREELPGILNRWIRGLKRLRKNGSRFTAPVDVRRAKKEWLRNANPLVAFLADRTKREDRSRVLVGDLYDDYCDWARENGITYQLQKNKMASQLEQLGYNVGRSNKGKVLIGFRLYNELLP